MQAPFNGVLRLRLFTAFLAEEVDSLFLFLFSFGFLSRFGVSLKNRQVEKQCYFIY